MRAFKPLFYRLLTVIGAILCAATARAQYSTIPPVDRSASVAAQQKVTDAAKQLSAATSDKNKLIASIKSTFQQKPEWASAQQELKDANAAREAVRKEVQVQLQNDPKYKKALTAQQTTREDLEATQKTGDTKLITEASNAKLQAAAAVKKIEDAALAADPKYPLAQKRWEDARAAAKSLDDELAQLISGDAEVAAADQKITDAKAVNEQARKDLAAAKAREQQAEKLRQQQMSQQNQNGGNYGNSRSRGR